MKTRVILFLLLGVLAVRAENLYVTPSGAGSSNGSDWNNAFAGFSDVVWGGSAGQVGAGDTLWVAGGGTYTGPLVIGASGSSGSRINIKRAVATESACTSAAGWSAAFDAQAVVTCSPSSQPQGVVVNNTSNGDYTTFDGMVAEGFLFNIDHTSSPIATRTGALVLYDTSVNNFEFKRFKVLGVNAPHNTGSAEAVGMQLSAISPNQNVDVTVSEGVFDVLGNPIAAGRNNGLIIERCEIKNTSTRGGSAHGNNIYIHIEGALGPKDVHIRYNRIHDNSTEGVYPACDQTCAGQVISNLFIYGNAFWNETGSGIKTISLDPNQAQLNNVQIHNNTFDTCSTPIRWGNRGGPAPVGSFTNNIFYNSGQPDNTLSHNYNWYSGTSANSEANGVIGGSVDPFIDRSTFDFHIKSTIAADYPRDKGAALASTYNTDRDGTVRGSDGTWDIGAYEFVSGAGAPGTIRLSSSTYSISEASTPVTITVQRVSGSTGAVGVNFATSNGTATSGSDYTATNGTLSWADADSANKTFAVVIANDGTAEGNETFNITLSSVTGGATLGLSSATVTIDDDETPGVPLLTSPWQAEDMLIEGIFIVGGGDVFQETQTDPTLGGLARCRFSVATAGDYHVKVDVEAANTAQDSVFINIDQDATNTPTVIWDVIPLAVTTEERTVGWRGTGTFDNPEFPTKLFTLSAGEHTMYIRGREPYTRLDRISVVPSTGHRLLAAPGKLRVGRR